jgi:2-polyprenyl-6-methoxyphenol hydroxylase-like FAD-dependent oxidoreductase
VALPHSAVVASEQTLLERMEELFPRTSLAGNKMAQWRILSSRPLPEVSEDLHFGERLAEAATVNLKPGYDRDASWVESLENGWLFLLPNNEDGWLLSVGAASEELLAQSSLIARQILSVGADARKFACHPRIADPLCGAGWLACGSAALGFDPLCGDGSGYAAREAILAAAVVRAAAQGCDVNELLAHYQTRLLAGFQKHLEVCAEFYRSGHSGPWWQEQIKATEQGLLWCRAKLANAGEFKFRLNGFSLERLMPMSQQASIQPHMPI